MSDDKLKHNQNVASDEDSDVENTRRKLLKRLGQYGAYTAPTMLSLMVADKAAAQSGGGSILPPPATPGPTAGPPPATPGPTAGPTPPATPGPTAPPATPGPTAPPATPGPTAPPPP